MDVRRRAVAWAKDDPFGIEFAEIALARQHLSAFRRYRTEHVLKPGELQGP